MTLGTGLGVLASLLKPKPLIDLFVMMILAHVAEVVEIVAGAVATVFVFFIVDPLEEHSVVPDKERAKMVEEGKRVAPTTWCAKMCVRCQDFHSCFRILKVSFFSDISVIGFLTIHYTIRRSSCFSLIIPARPLHVLFRHAAKDRRHRRQPICQADETRGERRCKRHLPRARRSCHRSCHRHCRPPAPFSSTAAAAEFATCISTPPLAVASARCCCCRCSCCCS